MSTGKALVIIKGNKNSVKAIVHTTYSRAGVHYYDLTIDGTRKLWTGEEIEKLTYVMGF